MRNLTMYKTTPIGVRLNLKNFISISCDVTELLKKVSKVGGNSPHMYQAIPGNDQNASPTNQKTAESKLGRTN